MDERFSRTALVLGEAAVGKLKNAKVALFGIGGVGGYCLEALARTGIGSFLLVDGDDVSLSNLNRQIIATMDNVGKPKVEVGKERVLSINPEAEVETCKMFFLPDEAANFDFTKFDYVIDAVDTVAAKIAIIEKAKEAKVPVISCMGAGNKMDPTAFRVADISKTNVCPLAKVMRHELKTRGIDNVKVVFSTEPALKPEGDGTEKRKTIGSLAPVVAAAGMLMANEVIKELGLK